MRPLLSVVMPSLNQSSFIESSIRSVLEQDWRNVELIVADGGSTDGTLEILQAIAVADSRLSWTSEPDTGPASALNKALARVRGTLVGWLNSDDLYMPGALSRAITAFEANPGWLLLYGRAEHIGADGKRIGPYPTLPPSTPVGMFVEGCFICQPTAFCRRTLFTLLGVFDEDLKCAFDMDYWMRAFTRFPERIGFVEALQAQSRLHDACITVRNRRQVMLEGMKVLARHLGEAPGAWVETFATELAEGRATDIPDLTKRQSVLNLLHEAKPWLAANEYARLMTLLESDTRLDAPNAAVAPLLQPATSTVSDAASVIDPRALIQQYSIDQHVQLADAYFAGREDHWYLYQKPFHHPQDCAPMLSNLGDLFAGLQLKVGMQVLDFAAGSCWLGRLLAQLGCKVVCCDASATALDIGRELFRRFPPIGASFPEPHFLVFDGAQIDLPDASMDRIVVNDAFHHMPNVGAILAEFSRVLKPGGIVGMSEPGRFHSQTEASQFEMSTYQVIENDVVLEDVWSQAQQAGFAGIAICPVMRMNWITISQYLECIDRRVPPHVQQGLVENTINQSIFFLYKNKSDNPCWRRTGIAETESEFDDGWYLRQFPDVGDAIRQGKFACAWDHYETCGRNEGRPGRP